MALCVGATVALIKGWQVKEPLDPASLSWIVGILVAAVFPLLAAERYFAVVPSAALPESPMLAGMCRLLIATLLGLAAACACNWLGFEWLALLTQPRRAGAVCAQHRSLVRNASRTV
jgi:hypothetical protein